MARNNMDMTKGPIFSKMIVFALPLMASGVLQLLFNAADTAVVGRFTGPEALAAVGSNGPLINLIVTLFMGLSVGTNVLTAQYLGGGQYKDLRETVHTSIVSSAVFGVILVGLGFVLARPMLNMMGSPEDVIDLAELYIRIYFLGMPAPISRIAGTIHSRLHSPIRVAQCLHVGGGRYRLSITIW